MPAWTWANIPDGSLMEASQLNTPLGTLQTVVNALDLNNIASKYVSTVVPCTMVPGQTQASFAPHVNDGTYYVRGWSVEQQGFAAAETATFELWSFTKSTGADLAKIDPGTIVVVAGSTYTAVDLAVVALPSTAGIRVKVTAGAIPASRTVTVNVQLGTLLMVAATL